MFIGIHLGTNTETQSGATPSFNYLLLESGFFILLEDGGKIELE